MRALRTLLLIAVLLLARGALAADASERVALVVGNSGYAFGVLPNPRNDATAMAALLRKAGFVVDEQIDTSKDRLESAIRSFGATIRDPKVKFGLFYYAGHGLQQNWRNYLVPVDAQIRTAADVPKQTVDVSELLDYMGQAKGRSFLVILDACRDDPFHGSYRPAAKGLSQFDAPPGSLLAYATAPGSVADDGPGKHGLYTSSLLQEFSVPGAKIEEAFKRVRISVQLASHGRQVPWETTSLVDDVYLFPTGRKKLSEAEQEKMLDEEITAWNRVRTSSSVEALADFLHAHPLGYTSELAQARLNRLMLAIARTRPARVAPLPAAPAAVAQASAPVADASAAVLTVAAVPPVSVQVSALVQKPLDDAKQQGPSASSEPAPVPATPAPPSAPTAAPVLVASLEPVEIPETPYSSGYAQHTRNYHVGEVLNFRIVDVLTKIATPMRLEVTGVDAAADHVEFNHGEYSSDLMGNVLKNTRGALSTPRQFYPAELYVGKKWQTMFKQQRPNGRSYTFKYDVRVVGREKVTVPAGTFDAFKIEARGLNVELGATLRRDIWVAPGIPADIVHETYVRLRSGGIDQYDRQELVSVTEPQAR